jgi:hypothetical protein
VTQKMLNICYSFYMLLSKTNFEDLTSVVGDVQGFTSFREGKEKHERLFPF